jgi:hypothetical protein
MTPDEEGCPPLATCACQSRCSLGARCAECENLVVGTIHRDRIVRLCPPRLFVNCAECNGLAFQGGMTGLCGPCSRRASLRTEGQAGLNSGDVPTLGDPTDALTIPTSGLNPRGSMAYRMETVQLSAGEFTFARVWNPAWPQQQAAHGIGNLHTVQAVLAEEVHLSQPPHEQHIGTCAACAEDGVLGADCSCSNERVVPRPRFSGCVSERFVSHFFPLRLIGPCASCRFPFSFGRGFCPHCGARAPTLTFSESAAQFAST